MNELKELGRLLPDSGKVHQNQEVWFIGGGIANSESNIIQRPAKDFSGG